MIGLEIVMFIYSHGLQHKKQKRKMSLPFELWISENWSLFQASKISLRVSTLFRQKS